MSTNKYTVELADTTYWRKQIKCQWGCPVNTDARGYVTAIADGRYLEAYKLARGPNPFASICGRVCGAPCEIECRRGNIDEPVTIRALKRFITEQYGVEKVDPKVTLEFSTARRDTDNPKAGAKVAIIGSGVAGLSAAHDLALLGYKVTVFEAYSTAGGMLITGVPLYRLPRKLVKLEIDAILSLGIELRLNTEVGKDITINEMKKQGFEAILISAGLQKSRVLNIEGSELTGVYHGIEFLKLMNTGQRVEVGDRVVVIGGGNVAFDVARSVVRKQTGAYKAELEEFYEAADAARTALRSGAKEVHLVCLESMEEMPADEVEISEGVEEGIVLHTSRGPLKIVGSNDRVRALKTRKVKSVFDEEGNFNPSFYDEAGETIAADTIILAIGQSADFGFLNDSPEIKLTRSGLIDIDPVTRATNQPGIFACGDAAEGAKLFINAIASGQRAAISIDEYLRNKQLTENITGYMNIPGPHKMSDEYLQLERIHPPLLDATKRATSSEIVELNYSEKAAREQGERCLKCHINTIFDGELCILCGGCVDVCPTHCLKLVSLAEVEIDSALQAAIENRYGVDIKEMTDHERLDLLNTLGSAMIKDEDNCIRCGFCAARCPTDAVTMEWFSYKQEYQF